MDLKKVAGDHLILDARVGSRLYGTESLIGEKFDLSPYESIGICIAPPEYLLGTRDAFFGWPADAISRHKCLKPGDRARTVLNLGHYARYLKKGDMIYSEVLFAPEEDIVTHPVGAEFRRSRFALISRKQGHDGYHRLQKLIRLVAEFSPVTVYPSIASRVGYHPLTAVNAARIGFQARQILNEGKLSFPLGEEFFRWAAEVMAGRVGKPSALSYLQNLASEVRQLLATSFLPEKPDYDTINSLVSNLQRKYWAIKNL